MNALILAAGYGTRLYPHTRYVSKALLRIGKKPIIDYLVDKVAGLDDVSRIIVVTNDRFFQHFQDWRRGSRLSKRIHLVNDLTASPQERLGAIGDMHFVLSRKKYSDDFLILGGDNIFKAGLLDFMRFARSKAPYVTIGLAYVKNRQEARHYGVVKLNKQKRLTRFSEKPRRPESNLVAMCLYYFPRKKLGLIDEYLNDPLNTRDAIGSYFNWLIKRDKAYGFVFKDIWFDIGHIHTYKKVEGFFQQQER